VFVQLIPFLVFYFVAIFGAMLIFMPGLRNVKTGVPPSWVNWYPFVIMGVLSLLTLSKDVVFFIWSRNRLYSRFREQAARNLGQTKVVAAPGLTASVAAPPILPSPVAQ